MKRGWVPLIITVLCGVAFGQDIGGRPDFLSKTDTQAEIEWGRAFYEQDVLKSGRLSHNDSYRRRVQRILDQLQSVMPYRPYPFQAVIIADNEANAGCYPGGYMVVHEGLLVRMPADSELAFVLAHEMGHAVRRHWARTLRKLQTDTVIDILASVLSRGRYSRPDRTLAYLSYSRDHESEADSYATELFLRAGFPPETVGDGMRVIVALDMQMGDQTPEYLRSHPDPRRRLANILALSKHLLANGLKPAAASDPIDLSLRSVFGDLPVINATGTSLMPFAPGTEWIYSVQSPSGATTYSTCVTGCADVLTSKVARFETKIGEKSVPFQVVAEPNRIYRRNRPDKPDSKWTLETLFPEYGGSEEVDAVQYRHAGVEKISTPAGVFSNCVKIETRNGDGRVVEVWYAPGVGMVKRINTSSQVTETLVSFRRGTS